MKILKQQTALILSQATGLSVLELEQALTNPPKSDMGDISFPCFKIAAGTTKKPNQVAIEIAEKLVPFLNKYDLLDSVQAVGPYVNFVANKGLLYKNTIKWVTDSQKNRFKKPTNGKTVVIDYSSPNIAKPIAFHHIRSTVIGNIIGNIFDSLGYKVVRINYLGDWGTQFGKLVTAFEKYGDQKKLEDDGVNHLLEIYVRYHKEQTNELDDEARKWFRLMEAGDEKAINYWKKFREISIKEFERVYKRLDVKFTNIEGESFYNKKSEEIINKIDKKIGTTQSDGALIIDLSKYDMPPVLLKKTDDTTLYATRDLAAAFDRMDRFNFDESLYVVANQQELHFRQIFKVLDLMGCEWVNRCKHIQFGLLHLSDGKMSTREGNVVFLEDVLNKSVELARQAIDDKNPDLDNKEEVAESIGVGAIIFGDVSKRRTQDITFKWEEILSFDGETAPYVQYTHARACSILKKTGFCESKIDNLVDYQPTDIEHDIIKLILEFESKLHESKNDYEPFVLARYVLDLSRAFNKYYYQEKLIDVQNEDERECKLALVYSVKETIKAVLSIMGIRSPERM